MMENNYKKALDLLKKEKITFRSTNGQSDDLISLAKAALSIKFPLSYEKFLKDCGYVSFKGFEIYGVIDSDFINSSVPDMVWLNISNRQDFNQPDHIMIIADIGDGSYYALDLSQMNEEQECPIVVWPIDGYEETPVLEVVAPDFGTWFLEKVQEQVNRKQEYS